MSFFQHISRQLRRTSTRISQGVSSLFVGGKLDKQALEHLEDALVAADVGVETAHQMVEELRRYPFPDTVDEAHVREVLTSLVSKRLQPVATPFRLLPEKPMVVLMVGVNGSGKTTAIGKLAAQFKAEGKKVHVAAGDTFRAGAVEQLAVWAQRAGVAITRPEKEGADPASVIFRACQQAQAEQADVLLCDTAGRLQNRQDLMAELNKIVRVIQKFNPQAPHATLLVIDATVGQNAHSQVQAFTDVANVSGLVVNKLDSTAKGGVLLALAQRFALPVYFVGIGETITDLQPFNATRFAAALIQTEEETPPHVGTTGN